MTPYARSALEYIAQEYQVSVADLRGPRRTQNVAWPRQEVMTLLYLGGYSFPKAGRLMGRDHSTVIHAFKAVKKRNPSRFKQLKQISKDLLTVHSATDEVKDEAFERLEKALKPFGGMMDGKWQQMNASLQYELKKKDGQIVRLTRQVKSLETQLKRRQIAYEVVNLREENEDLKAEIKWLKQQLGRRVAA